MFADTPYQGCRMCRYVYVGHIHDGFHEHAPLPLSPPNFGATCDVYSACTHTREYHPMLELQRTHCMGKQVASRSTTTSRWEDSIV